MECLGESFKLLEVLLDVKFTYFKAIIRATIHCGFKVWEYTECEIIEGVLRLFIKTIFRLIKITIRTLYLKTGLENEFAYTLGIQIRYLIRVINMPPNPLSHL